MKPDTCNCGQQLCLAEEEVLKKAMEDKKEFLQKRAEVYTKA